MRSAIWHVPHQHLLLAWFISFLVFLLSFPKEKNEQTDPLLTLALPTFHKFSQCHQNFHFFVQWIHKKKENFSNFQIRPKTIFEFLGDCDGIDVSWISTFDEDEVIIQNCGVYAFMPAKNFIFDLKKFDKRWFLKHIAIVHTKVLWSAEYRKTNLEMLQRNLLKLNLEKILNSKGWCSNRCLIDFSNFLVQKHHTTRNWSKKFKHFHYYPRVIKLMSIFINSILRWNDSFGLQVCSNIQFSFNSRF